MARRKSGAPHVIAYWLTSASIAALAASFSSVGHGKSGKPCARFTAPRSRASRVISRMTDSVKVSALALIRTMGSRGAWCGDGSAGLAAPRDPYDGAMDPAAALDHIATILERDRADRYKVQA